MTMKLPRARWSQIFAIAIALLAGRGNAQEIAPAIQFEPKSGAKKVAIPRVVVLNSEFEFPVPAYDESESTVPATQTTGAPAQKAIEPLRIELSPAKQGDGKAGFQLLDVTERKSSPSIQGRTLSERERAVQEVRRLFMSKSAVAESDQ